MKKRMLIEILLAALLLLAEVITIAVCYSEAASAKSHSQQSCCEKFA